MKHFKILLVIFAIAFFSCSNEEKTIEGIWVKEVPAKPLDTVTIKKLKDKTYSIQSRYWKKNKPKVKSSTGTLENGKLIFENGKFVEIDFEKMIVENVKYIKL